MHDVVARLDGAQFLQRQGKLARAGSVALQIVFVETVEYLVVGENAQLARAVDESLVYSVDDRRERNPVATVGEYRVKSLDLLVAVREYADSVSFLLKALELVAYHVEILMVGGLRSTLHVDRCLGGCRGHRCSRKT